MNEEKKLNEKMDRGADLYFKKYKTFVEDLEKHSLVGKVKSIGASDVVALGSQLAQWEDYLEYCNESGNVNALGNLPKIAMDVITAVYGTSPLSVVASVQPIEELHGLVYFKQLRYTDSKGSVTANDIMTDPRTGTVTPSGYSSNKIEGEEGATGNGTLTAFTFTLAAKPIINGSLLITVEDAPAIYCEDVGVRGSDINEGTLLGVGVSGTVNYISGVVVLKFAAAVVDTKKIYAAYQENYELASDIPTISTFMDSKHVKAHVYALKGTVGMIQSFQMRKRWGTTLSDDLAKDLVSEINKEIFGDLIRKVGSVAQGATVFNKYVPAAVTKEGHYEGFKYTINDAEAVMIGNAGRGGVNVMIVGREMGALLQGMRDFKLLSDANTMGPHIFGNYRGRIVIRVPEQALLDSNQGLALFKGQTVFEAAASYSPYMPLAVTDMIPEAPNPLTDQRAAATVAAVSSLVPAYATKINITNTAP